MYQALVNLETCCCGECGVYFAVPQIFINQQKEVSCPNGHLHTYGRIKEPSTEERAEVIQALHRAEQAEARAEEAESKLAKGLKKQKNRSRQQTKGANLQSEIQ